MKATLIALLVSLAPLAPSISNAQSTPQTPAEAVYEARVIDAAAHFLVDIRLVKFALATMKPSSRVRVCYQLGMLNYTTNQLFNLAANGYSTEQRRMAAKQILKAKADFEVTCGTSYEYTAAFQLNNAVPLRLATVRQIEAKLTEIESIAMKIHQGEIR